MSTPLESNDATIQRVLAGEIDAFAEIIRDHQQVVWSVVAAMLVDVAETEELVQRTFVKAYQHLNQFRFGQPFQAWIKQIARNEVRQQLRARRRARGSLAAYDAHLASAWSDPGASAHEEKLAEALAECTARLPAAFAHLIRLRYDEAWDFGQIAVSVGRTVEATRQQLARIRVTLRDCIEKHLAKP